MDFEPHGAFRGIVGALFLSSLRVNYVDASKMNRSPGFKPRTLMIQTILFVIQESDSQETLSLSLNIKNAINIQNLYEKKMKEKISEIEEKKKKEIYSAYLNSKVCFFLVSWVIQISAQVRFPIPLAFSFFLSTSEGDTITQTQNVQR